MAGLTGMKDICKYVSRSEATVLDLIRNEELPAKKIKGTWESDTELIDSWRKEKITPVKPKKPHTTINKPDTPANTRKYQKRKKPVV